jgi:hypothetical protein
MIQNAKKMRTMMKSWRTIFELVSVWIEMKEGRKMIVTKKLKSRSLTEKKTRRRRRLVRTWTTKQTRTMSCLSD